ncbi:MAG: hypothetical protein IPG46_07345 [Actinobacteria bacterium]|nr:hypothetical protein [Actinomycetota bacterium]
MHPRLRRLGERAIPLDDHEIVTRAIQRGALIDDTPWAEGLHELCRSLDLDAQLDVRARRHARTFLTELLVHAPTPARPTTTGAAAPPSPGAPSLVIASFDDAAVENVLAALGDRLGVRRDPAGAPCDDRLVFASQFTGFEFERTWHVPRYSEWYDACRPTWAFDAVERSGHQVAAGAEYLEHLDLVHERWPNAVVVMVRTPLEPIVERVARAAIERRHVHTPDLDEAKVWRYWRWRVERAHERADATASTVAAVIECTAPDATDRTAALIDRLIAVVPGLDAQPS